MKEIKVVKYKSNKTYPQRLTIGKLYEVIKDTAFMFIIKDDKGYKTAFGKNSFMQIESIES